MTPKGVRQARRSGRTTSVLERVVERGTEALWPTPSQELLLRAALLSGPAAWQAWTEWKSQHDLIEVHLDHGSFRLLPLVYKSLAAHGTDEPLMPRLKGIYRYWWCWNQRVLHRGATVIETLHRAGFRTVVLKGAAASVLFYQDTGVRPMADVDVLVPSRQALEAVECLERFGWRITSGRVAEEIRYRHSTQMVNGEGQEFDLHWHALRECLRDDLDHGLWERSVPVQILHVQTRALGPTDALLHTIVHGMRWNEEPTIRWIPDAMAILRAAGEDIDWRLLRDEARERRVLLRLVRGLGYLRRALDAPIPEEACNCLLAARPSGVERLEYRYLALGSPEDQRSLWGYGPLLIMEYLRVAAGKNIFQKLADLPGFLRYRLRDRTEPALMAVRWLARMVRRMLAPRMLSHGRT
jgi:hypothetical protein